MFLHSEYGISLSEISPLKKQLIFFFSDINKNATNNIILSFY